MSDGRDPSPAEPSGCLHFYRKGYFLDSDADYCCMLCGAEASAQDVVPAGLRETDGVAAE